MKRPINTIKSSWAKLPIRYKGSVVVAIPAACLIITLGAWIWSREALLAVRTDLDQIEKNINLSEKILAQHIDAETGVRGYSITRDSSFLQPYEQALTNIPPNLQGLEQKSQKQSSIRGNVEAIKELSQENIVQLQRVIDLTRSQPEQLLRSPQLNQVLNTNKASMDSLRGAIGQFQSKEQLRYEGYDERRRDILEATSVALWSTAIFSALGSWAAIYLFSQVDQELQEREQRLKESKSLLQAIVSNVVDGVITLDDEGKIDIFNPAASTMFGYQPAEAIGKELSFLVTDASLREAYHTPERALLTGNMWKTMGLRSDQSQFPISVSLSDMQLDDHQVIAIIRDMTDVQQTQEKLESRATELARLSSVLAQTNLTLEDRNRELEQFAYVASHDLKAPLRAIANLSEWIEEDLQGQLPDENQYQMKLLRGRVHRLEALIDALLEYSRVGRTKQTIESVNVMDLVEDVVESLDPPPTFSITLAPNLPTFQTKAVLLRQVFANLISNALSHHDRPDGHIQISSLDQGQHYEFIVQDDGPGIHADYHKKIFVIFQTLQARDTKESTGIGLAIVKKIVESEGGTIWVESQEGEGAAFHFTWTKV